MRYRKGDIMIEIIYNNNGKKDASVIVKPPKNIRQIGTPRGRHKIYIEDYVYTYLHSALFEGTQEKKAAVLIGKSEVAQDIRYSFISGAINCEDFIFQENEIIFDESCWEYIYKEIKSYFDQQEVVGWFIGTPGFTLQMTPAIESAHRKYFTGREKIVFLSEPTEKEDIFYTYEQGHLQKKEGYYIYYEKNLPMQEYMVSSREKARESNIGIEERIMETAELENAEVRKGNPKQRKQGSIMLESCKIEDSGSKEEESPKNSQSKLIQSEEAKESQDEQVKTVVAGIKSENEKTAAEEALQNYRAMLVEKKGNSSQKKMSVILYTASSVVLVVLCVIGITTLNNYEKMKNVEQTLSLISNTVDEEQKQVADNSKKEDSLTVETISGGIVTEKEKEAKDTAKSGKTENGSESSKKEKTENDQDTQQGEGSDKVNNNNLSGEEESATDDQAQTGGGKEEKIEDKENNKQETIPTMAQTYLEQGYYLVQPGDKLEVICKNIYQTTAMMEKICEINGIEDGDIIYSGQKIILP